MMPEQNTSSGNAVSKKNKSQASSQWKTNGSKVGGNVSLSDHSELIGRDKYEGLSGKEVNELVEVFLKFIKPSYLKSPEDLDLILLEFQSIQDEIFEWKELHNSLDSTIQVYGQFHNEVQRSTRKCPNTAELLKSWWNIGLRLDEMLIWAKTIKCIGKKYEKQGDILIGEPWAVVLETIRCNIEQHLQHVNQHVRHSNTIYEKIFGYQAKDAWCRELRNLSSQYHSTVMFYMHYADDNLRKCINKLNIVTEKFMVR